MQEIWKFIPGYEGLYQISNLGNIKSLIIFNGTNSRILKPIEKYDGYRCVDLVKNKVKKRYSIHRLVGFTFLGLDIDNKDILVCHRNDVKNDNRVENLFIGTQKDNIEDMMRKGRGGENKRSKPIYQNSLLGEKISEWKSATYAGKILGIYQTNITKCCKGLLKKTGGFTWEYK